MSREAENMRKVILVIAAIALLASLGFSKSGNAAPIPGVKGNETVGAAPALDLPPPPAPEFFLAAPPSPAPVQPSQTPVAPSKPTVTPPIKSVPLTRAAPPKIFAQPVMPPAPAAPVPAPAGTVPAAPPANVAVAPPANNGEWKILIRPEFYKVNDPWEYVRTGQVSWSTPAAPPAPQGTSSAAVAGDVVPPPMAGAHAPVAAASGMPCGPSGYKAAYAAVPFSRAEYEANPSYRQEAAMELLFGTLRPTTIMKQNQPYFSRYPDMFRYRHTVYPYLTPGSNTLDVNYYWNYPGYW